MEMFQRVLKTAVEGGASDVHLKIGTPVIFRINRQLIAIECPLPTEEWVNKIVDQILPAHLKPRIDPTPGVPGRLTAACVYPAKTSWRNRRAPTPCLSDTGTLKPGVAPTPG